MAALVDSLWSPSITLLILLSICVYYVSIGCYRLYLSPLAKFPGPRLAALTYWYEFYYNVVRRGQLTFELAKLHEKYGECRRLPTVVYGGSIRHSWLNTMKAPS